MDIIEQPEVDVVEIKKLPPGEAEGARDLQTWARRRVGGRSGSGELKEQKQDLADRWIEYELKRRTKSRRKP